VAKINSKYGLKSRETGSIKKKTISMASRKSKARELQKYVAEKISNITDIPWGKEQLIASREMGQAGTDIRLIGEARKKFPFAVECKRTEKLNLHGAIKQAKDNVVNDLPDWLVISRRSGEKAIVSMDADKFFEIYGQVIPKKAFFENEHNKIK